MEPRKRLALYEAALIDWEKPIEECEINDTDAGFCWYFKHQKNINLHNSFFQSCMPELYQQRITGTTEVYHYVGYGDDEHGRTQRVAALKAAIAEVKLLIEKK